MGLRRRLESLVTRIRDNDDEDGGDGGVGGRRNCSHRRSHACIIILRRSPHHEAKGLFLVAG